MIKRTVTLAIIILISKLGWSQTLTVQKSKDLSKAHSGEVINLENFLTEDFPKIAYQKIVLPGPQFLISDDPEYIRVPEAIVLKEIVQPGAVRLYVYNVNGVVEPNKMPRKITAVIKNLGKSTLHMKMLKYSSQKPSGNYYLIGKQGLYDYFNSKPEDKILKIAPNETIAIDQALENNVVNYDELVHGLYEFVIDEPAEIAILQTSPDLSGPKAYQKIKNIIPSGHRNAGRGLFGTSNYLIKNQQILDTKNGVSQLIIADGKEDTWVLGKEGYSGEVSKLAGNYGVMYDIDMDWQSSDGKGLALVTWNSRNDNKWCSGMANTVLLNDGDESREIVKIPAEKLVTSGAPEAVVIKVFKPIEGKNIQHIKLRYSPPGASCLPTPLVFIPIDLEK